MSGWSGYKWRSCSTEWLLVRGAWLAVGLIERRPIQSYFTQVKELSYRQRGPSPSWGKHFAIWIKCFSQHIIICRPSKGKPYLGGRVVFFCSKFLDDGCNFQGFAKFETTWANSKIFGWAWIVRSQYTIITSGVLSTSCEPPKLYQHFSLFDEIFSVGPRNQGTVFIQN